ncbi:MAG: phospholipid carrier-dependent glycosyltransferase [Jaaginema sp. PMC 1079.18]|nr:phospholipid carrier-dependent glycosyltransferase [Jaaginema sp. PMC 1080.18]MEC4851304.1 phospholipid carrier-dependent glycosyltransferase [Jaaginema sp. PMC 1079.18]MEC4867126.1 phospholipid carrier-dependent glycosyltransferase [Jaaginema sp. PMC 1078.18]
MVNRRTKIGCAIAAIWIVSVGLRFWRLSELNTLVFDEVYYPVFANRYLLGLPVYNAHPPLSQYLLTFSIWIGDRLPIAQDTVNGLLGSLHTPFSYRWLNALIGSFMPLVVGAIAYELNRRPSYALIAASFAALDGLFLVESRFALNNIYLVLFGLLGQLYALKAIHTTNTSPRRQLIWAGFWFGAAAAIKWNGLGFLLGFYLIWGVARLLPTRNHAALFSPALKRLQFKQIVLYLGILPVVVYSLLWIPHLILNPHPGFWEMQQRILNFHQNIGSGTNVHPYCSPWYSWLWMQRPVAYFYNTARSIYDSIPAYPPLPSEAVGIIYDVHAMGNPILWWLSTGAIALLLILGLYRLLSGRLWQIRLFSFTEISLYLLLNYGANLLPWLKVTRCTFLYHYMSASIFATLALAWWIDLWLHSTRPWHRRMAIAFICLIILAFSFWLPIYLGLPLSPDSYRLRMWFESWI